MSLLDRLFSTLRRASELDGKVERLGASTEALHADLRQPDRRLISVETALELASEGRFRPRLLAKDDAAGEG